MSVGTFTSSPTAGVAGTLSGTGTQTFTVGATLTIATAQLAGTYTNATDLDVTVGYN